MDTKKIESGFRLVMEGLGLDLSDPHMADSPQRVAKAWTEELCRGLKEPELRMRTFPLMAGYDPSMVVLQDIPVKSLCAHHLLPFVGKATVAYIPQKKLCGLSKLSRIVDHFSRKPQVQENLTHEIARFLQDNLDPLGIGVIVKASHFCMELRGVNHKGVMTTSTLMGVFLTDPTVRAEFMALAQAE
ncbi:MAG: GTP cyclohydrolase I [Deltaproteobacteria bacterium]|nr:GTP cyclohydrolase I [Deltaproteobacteria bacterium]